MAMDAAEIVTAESILAEFNPIAPPDELQGQDGP